MPKRRSPLLLSELELAERSAAAIASSITEGLELPRSQAVLSGYNLRGAVIFEGF